MRISVTNDSPDAVTEIVFPTGINIDQQKYDELITADHIGTSLSMERWFERGGSLGDGIPYPSGYVDCWWPRERESIEAWDSGVRTRRTC
jgi:hypothetical protein